MHIVHTRGGDGGCVVVICEVADVVTLIVLPEESVTYRVLPLTAKT